MVLIALVNLMHFSQGWVQFGYRFSNDFAPFALVLVALGIAAPGRPPASWRGARDGPDRRVDRGQPVGRDLEPAARMVTRFALAAAGSRRSSSRVVAFGCRPTALLPGVAFWDTGEFQTVGPLLGTAHPTGFPTYVLLGWLASVVLQPFGEPAFRMNLFVGDLPRAARPASPSTSSAA